MGFHGESENTVSLLVDDDRGLYYPIYLGIITALRRSPLFPFPSHLAKFPFPSHLATFPSRGCARLELEKAATENRQM